MFLKLHISVCVCVLYRYHIHLVELLAVCTEGKNVYTEIKCNSLLPLDDIVRVVTHEDCIPEVCVCVCVLLNTAYIIMHTAVQ